MYVVQRGFFFVILLWLCSSFISCGSTCSSNRDCEQGLYCLRGQCIYDCQLDEDCGAGKTCNRSGKCMRDENSSLCEKGEEKECYPGDENLIGKGECKKGKQVCENGQWSSCKDAVIPSEEVCDNKDNDCDGQVDEGLVACGCKTDADCVPSKPDCRAGKCYKLCSSDKDCSDHQTCKGDFCEACPAGTSRSAKEECNGKDDNCNGLVDEQIKSRSCFSGDQSKQHKGLCRSGQQTCNAGTWSSCQGEVLPTTESCDQKDNDCDGQVDEGCDCTDGATQSCGSSVGICQKGSQTCNKGKWSTCHGEVKATTEECNGLDDDCDGQVDESYPEKGTNCTNGWFGSPQQCKNGKLECQPAQKLKSHSFHPSSQKISALAISPTSKTIVAGDMYGNTIFYDLENHKYLSKKKIHTKGVLDVEFAPDGKKFYTAGMNKMIVIWENGTRKVLSQFAGGHSDAVTAVAIHPQNHLFASTSWDNTVRLYSTTTRAPIKTLKAHTSFTLALDFSPDGKWLATASLDKTIKIWDAATFVMKRSFSAHTDAINDIKFTPDSKRLISVSDDKSIQIWNVATGQKIKSWYGHTDAIKCMDISKDGKFLITGGKDAKAKVWRLSDNKLLETFGTGNSMISSIRFQPNGLGFAYGKDSGSIIFHYK